MRRCIAGVQLCCAVRGIASTAVLWQRGGCSGANHLAAEAKRCRNSPPAKTTLRPRCDFPRSDVRTHTTHPTQPPCAKQHSLPAPPSPPPPSFWKRVSNLDRAETKRYLEALYVLKMRWAGGAFVGLGVGVG